MCLSLAMADVEVAVMGGGALGSDPRGTLHDAYDMIRLNTLQRQIQRMPHPEGLAQACSPSGTRSHGRSGMVCRFHRYFEPGRIEQERIGMSNAIFTAAGGAGQPPPKGIW